MTNCVAGGIYIYIWGVACANSVSCYPRSGVSLG